jgi:hypothetical protein
MPLSFLFGAKPQPVQSTDLTPADPYDISRLTPQQWSELYKLPQLRELQQRIFPGQERWDHPELDQAVTQAAINRVREQVNMNTLKTSAQEGVITALAQFGVKTSFFPYMSEEEESQYEPGWAPGAAGLAGIGGLLGSHFSGGSMPESLGLMAALNAGVGGATAAAEAPEGDRLRHGLYAAGGSLGGAAVGGTGGALAGGGIGAGVGAGLGGLMHLLTRSKAPLSQSIGRGAAGGAAVGGMVGGARGIAGGATDGVAYGQMKAQQHSKNKAAKKPASNNAKPGGKPNRDGDGDGKKNEAKKAKSDGEKKAFEMFFGKSAALDLWDPQSGAVMNGLGGTRGSNMGTAIAPAAAPAAPRKFTMEDLLMAKQRLAASGVPAGGMRAPVRPMPAPAAAPRLPMPRMPVKLGGAEDALENFGLQKQAWAPLLAAAARLAPMAMRAGPMLARGATMLRGAIPGLAKEVGTQMAVGGAINAMTPTPKPSAPNPAGTMTGPMGGFAG